MEQIIYFNENHYSEFSNRSQYAIRIDNTTWPTVTHFLMGKKYCLSIETVREHPTVDQLMGFITQSGQNGMYKWDVYMDDFLMSALFAKFNQHLELESMLAKTGTSKLVYLDEQDQYLGVSSNGHGKNMLGKYIMRVRSVLHKKTVVYDEDIPEIDIPEDHPIILSHPDDPLRLINLAYTYLECGEFHSAMKAAEKVVKIDCESETGHSILAYSLLLIGDYDTALAPLKECQRLNPAESKYLWWLSIAYERLGKKISAVLLAKRARELEDGH